MQTSMPFIVKYLESSLAGYSAFFSATQSVGKIGVVVGGALAITYEIAGREFPSWKPQKKRHDAKTAVAATIGSVLLGGVCGLGLGLVAGACYFPHGFANEWSKLSGTKGFLGYFKGFLIAWFSQNCLGWNFLPTMTFWYWATK